jgi:type IX secretion system PorP/SprF family membrane protein
MAVSLHGAVNQKDLNKEELGSLPMRGASTIKFKNVSPPKVRHGLGGFVVDDKAGLIGRSTFGIGYSYHLPLNYRYYLSFGATVGAHFFRLDSPTLREQGDDAFAGSQNFGTLPDGQFGLYLYSDRLQFGISATQLFANRMSFAARNQAVEYNRLTRHIYSSISYRISLDQEFDILPIGVFRYTGNSPLSVEGGAKIRYKNTFWAGASYRFGDAVVGMVGLSLSRMFDMSYAFDFTTSQLQKTSVGTHEIVLGIRLYNKKPNSSLKVW